MSARFTLFVTTKSNALSQLVQSLLISVQKGMSDGELSEANATIIRLKWIEMSDETMLSAPSISSGQGQPLNSLQRHWPILLGAFIFLLFILATLLWRRKKKKRVEKLKDDMDILRPSRTSSSSDIESKLSLSDDISVDKILHSQFGIMPAVNGSLRDRATTKESSDDSLVEDHVLIENIRTEDNIMENQEELLGFLEERKRKMGDLGDTR